MEAVALLALGVVELFSVSSDRLALGITNVAFFGLYAAGLAFAARGFARTRRWSRSPVVLAQLIQLGVAWSFFGHGTVWVAVILVVPAAVVLFVVFSPSTTEALFATPRNDDPPP